MRKLLLTLAVALVLIGALALPAAATPVSQLTALAEYFPDQTPLFAAVRTDDDYVALLDSVVAKLGAVLPSGSLPVDSLSGALDMMSQSFDPEGDFESIFRSWLGDTLAAGIVDASTLNERTPSMIIAAEITDAALAEEYMMATGALERYSREERDGFVLYSPMSRMAGQPFVMFRSDVMLISVEAGNVESGGLQSTPLSASETFTSTLASLPAAEYNGVIYNNLPVILQAMMESGEMGQMMDEMPGMYMDMMSAVGPQAYGATILDGRSLTIDLVSTYTGESTMEVLGVSMNSEPVDPTFARFIPAGTPLVIHANNASFNYGTQIDLMRTMFSELIEQGMGEEEDLRELEQVIFAFETGVRGLTGLEPEEAFGWMTGDVAMYLGLTPRAADASSLFAIISALPVDFAVTLEATDPAAAQALVDGLANGLENLPVDEVSVTREDIGGANALVITVNSSDVPFPLELVLAANDQVFSMGTRRYVTFAMQPGEGLDTDPAFQEAAATLLPNASAVLYAAGEGLQPLARLAQMEDNPSSTRRDGEMLEAFFNLVSSSSISAAMDETGTVATGRMVWTLPE
ncbi:MAG: DUF3352 domain-containing protein [Chloroflexi bacterium]|nr:DUF3352 domain-containing protein [Chloroflexota bacterium]